MKKHKQSYRAGLWLAFWFRDGARSCRWRPPSLVLTRWAGISTHFTRREVFRIAPWPGLSQAETFPDIRQQVIDDAVIVLGHNAFLDWKKKKKKSLHRHATLSFCSDASYTALNLLIFPFSPFCLLASSSASCFFLFSALAACSFLILFSFYERKHITDRT